MPHPKILKAYMHLQGGLDRLLRHDDVFFLPHHFADVRGDKIPDGLFVLFGRMSLIFILTSPIGLHRNYLFVEFSFNKVLKVVKDLKYIRFFLQQVYPCIFAEIFYEANIVSMLPNRDRCWPPKHPKILNQEGF